MPQASLDGLIAFATVAELSSFSGAAVRLQVSPSAVSQAVRTLEQRLGVALLNRTTRSVSLTETGALFLDRIAGPLRELRAANDELGAGADLPSGLLRLSVLRAAYMTVLAPILADFLAAYPDINVELSIESSLSDITARGFDAGVRFGDLVEQDMVAVPVGPPLSAHVIASPDYLARRGAPTHPRDLLEHHCIAFQAVTSGQLERWAFEKDGERIELAVRARLLVNDSTVMAQTVLDGAGVGYMSNGFIDGFIKQGRLVRLLPDWSPVVPGLTLFYPSRRRAPRKLRALIEFLRAHPHPARSAVDATFASQASRMAPRP
jgi:DNA-binding transcriptional LysR family regulator